MEKTPDRLPSEFPETDESILIPINAAKGDKACVFMGMAAQEFRAHVDANGRLTRSAACEGIVRLGENLADMGKREDISMILADCERLGLLVPDRLTGWEVAPEPERKRMW